MFRRTRLGLPAERFFVNLLDGHDAMLMCVWQSPEARAYAILSADGRDPMIAGCDIGCGKDKSLWVAFLEGAGLWHEQTIAAEKTSQDVSLDWRVPFSAKWRADFLRPDGFAHSWYFASPEFNDSRCTGPNAQPCPCTYRSGQASVRAELGPQVVVTYPIDRTRSTPLEAFCPIDILRSTLGIGPCQYILQTEGLASETNPTPDEVVTWAEKQFKRKKVSQDEIHERFERMVDYVGRAQSRLDTYADGARELKRMLTDEARAGGNSDALRTLRGVIDRLEQAVFAPPNGSPVGRARNLADQITALVGRADAAAECQRIGAEIRHIGAYQDRALANGRMAIRWLERQSEAVAAADPRMAELASKIRAQVQRAMKTKQGS
jgi:hypothetical protein